MWLVWWMLRAMNVQYVQADWMSEFVTALGIDFIYDKNQATENMYLS